MATTEVPWLADVKVRSDGSLNGFRPVESPAGTPTGNIDAPADLQSRSYRAVSDALDVYRKTAIRMKALLGAASISAFNAVQFARLRVRLMEIRRDFGETTEP